MAHHVLNLPVEFGGQTVVFVSVAESGAPGYLGVKAKARVETPVSGCRFRSVQVTESADGETNTAEGQWKCTAPPVAAVLAAKSSDEVKVAGVTYQIVGPVQPKRTMDGRLHHVTVMCKRQAG